MSIDTSADVRTAYDRWHEQHAASGDDDRAGGPWYDLAVRHLPDLRGRRVLEIGCGRGGFSHYLRSAGADLVSADFSESAARLARSLLGRPAPGRVVVADVQRVPYPDDAFDVVVSLETLEHVPDPDRGLAELVRITRPGGRLVVSTPNYFGPVGVYRAYRELTGRPWDEGGQPLCQPLWLVSRVRRLRRLGCRVLAVDGCGHYLYWPGRNPRRIGFLDHPRFLMKWVAHHSLTVATK